MRVRYDDCFAWVGSVFVFIFVTPGKWPPKQERRRRHAD